MRQTLADTMMERLQVLPLFQGMSQSDMTWLMEKLRFDFSKVKAGDYIVCQDCVCDSLIFILSGEVEMEARNSTDTFCFHEKIAVPNVLQPEFLFGPQTRYTSSFKATTDTNILKVSKSEFWTHLIGYEVFRLNFLNLLSARAQNAQKIIWASGIGTLEQRLIRFFLKFCQKPVGEKMLKIKMEDLAAEMSETRANISKVLNEMQQAGLIRLKRSAIEIPRMELLYNRL